MIDAVADVRYHAAGVAQVYERADSILSGQSVKCRFIPIARGVAAFSSGSNIFFNESMINDLHSTQDMIVFAGLNYHELAHVMFTPKPKSLIRAGLTTKSLQRVWNILEDQRIETLLSAQWASISEYLAHMMGKHILEGASDSDLDDMHFLCHGRRYLDQDLRDVLRIRFERSYGPEMTLRIEDYIDEFITLSMADKASQNRGLQIVRDVQSWLTSQQIIAPTDPNHKAAREGVDEMWADAEDDRDIDDMAKRQISAVRAAQQDQQEKSDEASDEAVATEGGGSGAGSGDGDIREMAQAAVDEAQRSKFVQDNTRDMQKAINRATGNDGMNDDGSHVNTAHASAAYLRASKRFAQVIQRLTIDADPNWKRRVSSGRLNMQRVMQGVDPDEAFDMWESGQEDTSDIALCILIDNSSSMASRVKQASEAAWAVKNAVESIGGDVLVMSFTTTTGMVYPMSEKAKRAHYRVMGARGGTNPRDALHRASHVLRSSTRRKKMLLIITDGDWSSEMDSERLIRDMNHAGVTTALGFLHTSGSNMKPHDCQVALSIGHPMDIVHLAEAVVLASMQTGATT